MSYKKSEQNQSGNPNFEKLHKEVDQWFSVYLQAFMDIGASKIAPEEVLKYWGVPLHFSSPKESRWLLSTKDVVTVLQNMQAVLKNVGYTHTVALDKKIYIFSEYASRVETIMSRRRADHEEVDRVAVSFEIRRADQGWFIISAVLKPTMSDKLQEVW